jgi:hypothetical protein
MKASKIQRTDKNFVGGILFPFSILGESSPAGWGSKQSLQLFEIKDIRTKGELVKKKKVKYVKKQYNPQNVTSVHWTTGNQFINLSVFQDINGSSSTAYQTSLGALIDGFELMAI